MRNVVALCLLSLCAVGMATAQVGFSSTFYTDSQTGEALGVTSGDFNRDGKPDVAVGTGTGVDIWTNIGSGKFSGPVSYATGGEAAGSVRAADINNDGWLDLVVATFDNNSSTAIFVLLNNGDGTFRPGSTVTTSLPPGAFDLGDLNRDGNIDMVVLECDSSSPKCQFQVFLGNGTGNFAPGQTLALANASVGRPILADMNGDGKLDLVNLRQPKVFVWPGTGSGTFGTPTSFQPPTVCTDPNTCSDGLSDIAVADFNNDSRLDIAVLQGHYCPNSDTGPCGSNTLYTYKNNGGMSFSLAGTTAGSTAEAGGGLYVSDLNGDQNADVMMMDNNIRGGYAKYLLGKGNFTFGPMYDLPGGDTNLVARDFNLDSRHDLAISAQFAGGWTGAINTSAFTNCAPPSSANLAAKICRPAANASVTSPVLVRASGNSPAGIQRLEVWIDGVKKYQKWNDQLAKSFSLSAGTHRIAVVAVDMYKGTATKSVTVSVH